MIRQEDIINWLKDPNLLSDSSILEIKQELDIHPYFQPYYFLLLKYYKKQSKWEFEKLLKKSALHIFDRRTLFLFINDLISIDEKKIEKDTAITFVKESIELEETSNHELIKEQKISEPVRREDIDSLEEALSDAMQKHVSEKSYIQEKSILPEISFELDEKFEIVRPNNSENIDYSTFQNIKEFDEILQFEIKNEEDIFQQEDNQLHMPGVVLDMHEELPDDSELFEKQSPKEENDKSFEFTAWFAHLEKESDGQNGLKASTTPNTTFDLIDKFLLDDPRMKPKPLAETEQEDISESSIEEHEDFITDTLAKIYLKQGNYSKAILAYEKLSLKFPEKNTYFASQIKEINKLINNQ